MLACVAVMCSDGEHAKSPEVAQDKSELDLR
jgi:hypothetical protein